MNSFQYGDRINLNGLVCAPYGRPRLKFRIDSDVFGYILSIGERLVVDAGVVYEVDVIENKAMLDIMVSE